jgi:signal recognition particle receptor subunit alpha
MSTEPHSGGTVSNGDVSTDATPIATPETSRPSTPADHVLSSKGGRPIGAKLSRRDKKARMAAMNSTPVTSGDEGSIRKGKQSSKGSAKKNRVWDEFGGVVDDDGVANLDYSETITDDTKPETLEEIKQETWGRRTAKGEFILKDLDEEMDTILAQSKSRDVSNDAKGSLLSSGVGVIGGLFRNVVGGKTLTKEDLAKPMKQMEEHLLKKNVAREAAVRLCESVENDLVGAKTGSFTSKLPTRIVLMNA